jgi:hypothetical protein
MTGFDPTLPRPVIDVLSTPPEIAAKAMRAVARNSDDAASAAELMQMLGLIESTETEVNVPIEGRCTVCDKPMYSKRGAYMPRAAGAVRQGARGMCTTHYQVVLRAERAAEQ